MMSFIMHGAAHFPTPLLSDQNCDSNLDSKMCDAETALQGPSYANGTIGQARMQMLCLNCIS